jgi:hypothetical protein
MSQTPTPTPTAADAREALDYLNRWPTMAVSTLPQRQTLAAFIAKHADTPEQVEAQTIAPTGGDAVERVARAVAILEGWEAWDTARSCCDTLSGNEPDEARDGYRDIARAALAAAGYDVLVRRYRDLLQDRADLGECLDTLRVSAHTANEQRIAAEAKVDELVRENERLREAQARPIGPDTCPITGRPFFMNLEHPDEGMVATYGGPFDSYTIPAYAEQDAELRCERYDHDADHWVEGGVGVGYLYPEQSYSYTEYRAVQSRAETAERERDEAKEKISQLRQLTAMELRYAGSLGYCWFHPGGKSWNGKVYESSAFALRDWRAAIDAAIAGGGVMAKREFVTYLRPGLKLENGEFVKTVTPEAVRVVARAEGYAMVRKKGAMPFAVPERDLRPIEPTP